MLRGAGVEEVGAGSKPAHGKMTAGFKPAAPLQMSILSKFRAD
jgi:hypothetical protein